MKDSKLKYHLAILGANILFALNYSYSKSALSLMSADVLLVARIASAALFFVLFALIIVRQKVALKDIWMLLAAAVFGVAGNQFIFLHGLALTSPVDASIIATAGPVLVLLISVVLKRERITLLKTIGITIGAFGALWVIIGGASSSVGSGSLEGNALVFLSAFSYACYLIVVRQLMVKYSSFTIMAWVFGASSLLIVPLFGGDFVEHSWGGMSAGEWGILAFVVVGATWIAYTLVSSSLKQLSPTTVSIYSYSQPVLASLFAVVRMQDELTWQKIFSALLVFVGVYIVTLSYKKPRLGHSKRPFYKFWI